MSLTWAIGEVRDFSVAEGFGDEGREPKVHHHFQRPQANSAAAGDE
jgi:hypothetical protein